jgi:hypothetical protein
MLLVLAGCTSPEARRERDGGPGADIGNTVAARAAPTDPQTSDTTLWPGRNPAPVERQARGEIRPPAGAPAAPAPRPASTPR